MARFCFLLLFVVGLAAEAQLPDPMKPPAFALRKYQLELASQAGLKNKTAQAASKKTEKEKVTWKLSSILVSGVRSHAIINDRLVKNGDTINGAKVIRIDAKTVSLTKQGKTILLSLESATESSDKLSISTKQSGKSL